MPAWVLPAFFVGLVIYDTVIAQLSVTHMIPSSTLTCQLFERWETLFDNRDVDAVRRIQDAHQCCGFRTPRHMAWPWPDNQGADQCRRAYRRNRSCLESWRHDQQINAGLLLLVAVASFSAKVGAFLSFQRFGNRQRGPCAERHAKTLTASCSDPVPYTDSTHATWSSWLSCVFR